MAITANDDSAYGITYIIIIRYRKIMASPRQQLLQHAGVLWIRFHPSAHYNIQQCFSTSSNEDILIKIHKNGDMHEIINDIFNKQQL